MAESFFHSLKELIDHYQFRTRGEDKRTIFDYIEVFYNHHGLHSTNNYLSPTDDEGLRKTAQLIVRIIVDASSHDRERDKQTCIVVAYIQKLMEENKS